MTDTTNSGADAAPADPSIVVIEKSGMPESMGAREAGRLLSSLRKPKVQATPVKAAVESAPVAPAVQESTAQVEDAAPPATEVTGETQEADPAAVPPIERPRSWAKEHDEHWKALPRETQEYLSEQASQASAEVRRSQNEAAEKLKGLSAKEQAVEQARQQYESALPILLNNLQSAMAGEFSDIRTMADVTRLANEDFARYIRWDAQQKQVAAVQQEVATAQQRQVTEKSTKLQDFMKQEAALFAEKAPEINDPAARTKLMDASVNVLKDLGFKDEELGKLWRGEQDISIHDHRLHLLIRDGVRWQEAQQKARTATAKPVPQVQRPGVAPNKGAALQVEVQALTKKLDNARNSNEGARIAAQLIAAQRRAAAR